ncbi:hypothetical protein LUZ60_011370 [Juncus effusus]|nr:hypothetical protein LUZ60_011370 [Juncus effusus]
MAVLLLLPLFFLLHLSPLSTATIPTPTPWPEQFHSLLFMNYSGELSLIDLWYDWPKGRNFNIIKSQLGGPALYDLEWTNGTSFFYTLEPPLSCRSAQVGVGILRPDWLDGAVYVDQVYVNGFLCNEWTKADFIWYYEDVETKRPVKWVFYTGRTAHVMTFEVGAALQDSAWQAPVYCFENTTQKMENQRIKGPFFEALEQNMIEQKKILEGLASS